jgi:hypothetical protein
VGDENAGTEINSTIGVEVVVVVVADVGVVVV